MAMMVNHNDDIQSFYSGKCKLGFNYFDFVN
jgi:hypothetical protein